MIRKYAHILKLQIGPEVHVFGEINESSCLPQAMENKVARFQDFRKKKTEDEINNTPYY